MASQLDIENTCRWVTKLVLQEMMSEETSKTYLDADNVYLIMFITNPLQRLFILSQDSSVCSFISGCSTRASHFSWLTQSKHFWHTWHLLHLVNLLAFMIYNAQPHDSFLCCLVGCNWSLKAIHFIFKLAKINVWNFYVWKVIDLCWSHVCSKKWSTISSWHFVVTIS